MVAERFATLCRSAAATLASTVMLSVGAQNAPPPDLTGSWERYRGPAGDPYTPAPEAPPPLKANLLEEWQARRAAEREADARGEPQASGYTHCLPDGVPSMMSGPFPFEIVQNEVQINIAQEAYSQQRRIYIDRPQASLDDIEPGFYGRSVAQWQGTTLVVDTIGIKEYVRFRDVPHTRDMRVTERLHLVAPDILWDEITVADPAMLTKPWTVTFAYKRMPNYEIIEYVCEDNREYADEQGVTRLRVGEPNTDAR
jgi:hypothetical protein